MRRARGGRSCRLVGDGAGTERACQAAPDIVAGAGGEGMRNGTGHPGRGGSEGGPGSELIRSATQQKPPAMGCRRI